MSEKNELSFSQAMNKLSDIVEQLNSPDLELEKAMELFKEGLALSRQCEGQLKAFEGQMNELLSQNQQGSAL